MTTYEPEIYSRNLELYDEQIKVLIYILERNYSRSALICVRKRDDYNNWVIVVQK